MEVNQFGFSGTTFTGIKLQVLKTIYRHKKRIWSRFFYAYFFIANAKNYYFKIEGLVVLKAGNQLGIFRL
jgi:hypothetical protein